MTQSAAEEFQLFIGRTRPISHQLFNLAHAVTGNCEQAEYALQSAMLDSWSAGEASASHHGFREGLRSGVIRAALRTEQRGEMDWDGLNTPPENADSLLMAIVQENAETRRLLALRYGCGLSPRRIARLTGQDAGRVQTLLHRFEARTRRRLPAAERRRYEGRIKRAVRSLMFQPCPQAPEMSSVLRTFQTDAAEVFQPSRLPARILHIIATVALCLFCIIAFWLTAVLIQPAVLETQGESTTIVQTE